MSTPKIIAGYKGVMPLDLTHIPVCLHAELIKEHLLDIKEYKKRQLLLPEEMRYENGVGKVLNDRKIFDDLCDRKAKEKLDESNQRFRELLERYNS
jgi:hypothetical protein|tara:strand:+ start:378 stop:665 length:288 start_codon:yes stop_codon:yes gene_type:complete